MFDNIGIWWKNASYLATVAPVKTSFIWRMPKVGIQSLIPPSPSVDWNRLVISDYPCLPASCSSDDEQRRGQWCWNVFAPWSLRESAESLASSAALCIRGHYRRDELVFLSLWHHSSVYREGNNEAKSPIRIAPCGGKKRTIFLGNPMYSFIFVFPEKLIEHSKD